MQKEKKVSQNYQESPYFDKINNVIDEDENGESEILWDMDISPDPMEAPEVLIGTYQESDPDNYDQGGYVYIKCRCNFTGYVDAEDSGSAITGECENCLVSFNHPLY